MNRHNKPCMSNQPSIYYRQKPDERISFELADFVLEEDATNLNSKHSKDCSTCTINKSKTSEILSTAQIISVFGQVWSLASRPFTFSQTKRSLNQEIGDDNEAIFNNLVEVNGKAIASSENKKICIDLKTDGQCSPLLQPTLVFLTVTQKMSMLELEPCKNYSLSSFLRLLQGGNDVSNELWKRKGLASIQISYNLGKLYGWMSDIFHSEVCYPVKVADTESMKSCASEAREDRNEVGGCISGDASVLTNKSINGSSKTAPYLFQPINLSSLVIRKLEMKTIENIYTASDILTFVQDIEADSSIIRGPNPEIMAAHPLPSSDDGALDYRHKDDSGEQLESEIKQPDKLIIDDEYIKQSFSSTCEKPSYTLPRQDYAFAGALAGVFVSVCLHPVDTIKTVVQSYHAEQRSLSYIGKSIVSDRGLSGLYRGVATNIASSAPISAVYTFTYESVKVALLPLLRKEYHSFAHGVAGGCASTATSFIFTPSERIKQQMQVSAHYSNCWNAFVGIVAKGGLRGLYTGWGAVLCRNIPHSIVKFYTYESLKGLMKCNNQPSTLQTLVSGGLAGSTAALFTTPFDVVKTRLQTQIPGSLNPYKNVIHALHEIGKKEGLKGLYRGLTPRLVMYMSQGAIFFGSYEFFKRLLSLEASRLAI